MTTYRWKTGARVKASAQDAGEVLSALERKGNLTASALVDASRPEDAPLHGCFEWDDAVAAERYRETQAGYIIRSVEVEIESAEPTRAFVSIDPVGDGRKYMSIDTVLTDAGTRSELLRQAMKELQWFRRKYADLQELASVFDEIDRMVA